METLHNHIFGVVSQPRPASRNGQTLPCTRVENMCWGQPTKNLQDPSVLIAELSACWKSVESTLLPAAEVDRCAS